MIKFHIVTIFPNIFTSYFNESIIKRAKEKGLVEIYIHNLRDFTSDSHRKVDDRPFGGGPGMVIKVEPVYKAVKHIKKGKRFGIKNSKIILFSPRGKKFNQKTAQSLSKLKHVVLICGRYEGVDERVAKYIADEEISIGDYILSGGELPAMVIVEAVTRLIPGVLGNIESIEERRASFAKTSFPVRNQRRGYIYSYPVYTRPLIFEPRKKAQWKVPKVLLSGNHKKIEEWRRKHIGKIY